MPDSIKEIIVRIQAQTEGFDSMAASTSAALGNFNTNIQEAEAHVSGFGTGMDDANKTGASFVDSLSTSAKGLSSVGEFGMQGIHIMDAYGISLLNVENSQMSLASAQIAYNESILKYGAHSQQAEVAANSLTRAQNNLDKSNTRASISTAMIGVTMVGQIPKIIEFGKTLTTTMAAAEISTTALRATIIALAPELLIIGAVAGGAYYLITSQSAAAQDASKEMTDGMVSGFTEAADSAMKLQSEIDNIKNSLESGQERALEADARRMGVIAAINASQLSAAEKQKEIERANLDYAKQIYNIRISQDTELIKDSKYRDVALVDIQTYQKKLKELDISGKTLTTPNVSEATSPITMQAYPEKQREFDIETQPAIGQIEALQFMLKQAKKPSIRGLVLPTISDVSETQGATQTKTNIQIRLDRQGTKDFLKDGIVDLLNYG